MTVASSTTAEHDGRRLKSHGAAAKIFRPSSVLTLDAVWLEAALVLRGLLLAGSAGLLFYLGRARGASAAAGTAACGLALLSIVGGAAIRPQLLAIPLFVFFIAGTTVWLRHVWILAALPLAMVVWANVHGSFPLGLTLIAAAIVGTALTGLF